MMCRVIELVVFTEYYRTKPLTSTYTVTHHFKGIFTQNVMAKSEFRFGEFREGRGIREINYPKSPKNLDPQGWISQ